MFGQFIDKINKKPKNHVKSVIQSKNYTCGPISILNAFNHLGVFMPFNELELEKLSNARPNIGTDNNDLVDVIKMFEGVSVHTLKNGGGTIEDLENELTQGRICIVNYFNAFSKVGHFAVVVGADETGFFFLDSVLGDLRLKKQTFSDFWHNSDGTLKGWYVSFGKKSK